MHFNVDCITLLNHRGGSEQAGGVGPICQKNFISGGGSERCRGAINALKSK